MDEDKISEKVTFARFINEQNLQLIGLLDTKTSIIIAINGVILALPFGSKDAIVSQELNFIFWSANILLGASAITGLLTILPRIKRKEPYSSSLIFHETVLDKGTFDSYKEEWDSLDLQRILQEEIVNVHRLAKALHYQFKLVRLSILFLILAIILLVALLFIH
jgi:pycsar effector protein